MNGLTMDVPLTIGAIARRAEAVHASRLVVSRQPSKTLERRSYGDVIRRARQLDRKSTRLNSSHT